MKDLTIWLCFWSSHIFHIESLCCQLFDVKVIILVDIAAVITKLTNHTTNVYFHIEYPCVHIALDYFCCSTITHCTQLGSRVEMRFLQRFPYRISQDESICNVHNWSSRACQVSNEFHSNEPESKYWYEQWLTLMSGLTTEDNCSVSFHRASYIHWDVCGCQKKMWISENMSCSVTNRYTRLLWIYHPCVGINYSCGWVGVIYHMFLLSS